MDLLLKALRTPHGRFAYVAPYYNQAKTVAWDVIETALHSHGSNTIDELISFEKKERPERA
jgi:hypothetical protein